MRRSVSAGLALVAFAAVTSFPSRAFASYHMMKIVEVFGGGPSAPNAHYVQLQMYSAGQSFLNGHSLRVYDAAGNEIANVAMTKDLPNGNDQATVLIGTSAVAATFGVTPDFVLPSNLNPIGGKVCFEPEPTAIDCFAWGSYGGDGSSTGTPFAALGTNTAAKRKTSGGTNPGALDDADDTNDCAADFLSSPPTPKNNAGKTGGLPAGDDGGPSFDAGIDSGVTTTPTDGGGKLVDSGAGDAGSGAGASSDDGGCSASGGAANGSLAGLGLVAAAALLSASRRRGSRRLPRR